MHHFCILCGVAFSTSPRPHPTEKLNWQQEIRAVFCKVDSKGKRLSPSLTGLGIFHSGAIQASHDKNSSYLDPQPDLHWHYFHYYRDTETWTFPFHDACWQILLEKLSLSIGFRHKPQHVVELLFNHLYCLPYDRFYNTYTSHDFEGAREFWKWPWRVPENWNFLLSDPNTVKLRSFVGIFHSSAAISDLQTKSEASSDCLSCFPGEIIHLIATFLRSRDLTNLRLSSPAVASVTEPSLIPPSFWKSRFAADREMGFFRPGEERYTRLSSYVDWRKLYFDVKLTLQDTSEAGHIRNRHRIWRCLDHLVNSLLPCLAQKPALQDHKTIELELSAEGFVATRRANGPISQNHPKSRGVRARLFGFQLLRLYGQSLNSELQISVSKIEFDGMEYICGIRVLERSQSNLKKETSRVGYIISDSEVHITILAQHRVTGIRVACSASGIIGLGLQVKGSARKAAWSYVNMTTEPLPHVGVATMEPTDGSSLSALIIGLDVCKFVSLQLVEQRSDDSTSSMSNAVSWLWHPREPETRRHGLILPSTPERPQIDSPVFILDMGFGGLEGILLPRLTRIAALHDDRIGCFRGFAFSYVDGSSKTFGMATIVGSAADEWPCIEQSFAVDGSGGERIISIEFVPELRPSKIKIATSRGRVLEFGRIAKTGKTLGVSASCQWHRLVAPTSQAISSILATVEISSGVIISLGLSYVSVSNASAPTSTLSEPLHTEFSVESGHPFTFSNKSERWEKAPVDLKGSNGCFTSVVLSNVRRIGVSVGLGGKSRGANHISGLCFEFWEPSEPIYVGQWYCEVGNVQLQQGERLQSFTFWQTQEAPPFSLQENYGKVTGVRICKVGYTREELEVCLGNKEDMLSYSFEENPYEGLTGLAWAFDHKLDHIYVLTEPSIYFPKTSLTLHNMKDLPPSSRTPCKLFWEAQDEGNGFYGLSCVHAIFHQETGDLKGFVFEYGTSHIIKQAGCIDGVAASMPLWEDQRIIRMDVCTGSGIDEVVFYTSDDKVFALSASGQSDQPRNQDPSDFDVFSFRDLDEGGRQSSSSSDTPSSQSCGATDNVVGIWLTMKIFPRASNVVEAIGPILATQRG